MDYSQIDLPLNSYVDMNGYGAPLNLFGMSLTPLARLDAASLADIRTIVRDEVRQALSDTDEEDAAAPRITGLSLDGEYGDITIECDGIRYTGLLRASRSNTSA